MTGGPLASSAPPLASDGLAEISQADKITDGFMIGRVEKGGGWWGAGQGAVQGAQCTECTGRREGLVVKRRRGACIC